MIPLLDCHDSADRFILEEAHIVGLLGLVLLPGDLLSNERKEAAGKGRTG